MQLVFICVHKNSYSRKSLNEFQARQRRVNNNIISEVSFQNHYSNFEHEDLQLFKFAVTASKPLEPFTFYRNHAVITK